MQAVMDPIQPTQLAAGLTLSIEHLDVGGGVIARGPHVFDRSNAGLPVTARLTTYALALHDEGDPALVIEVAMSGCTRVRGLRWGSTYQTEREFDPSDIVNSKEPLARGGWRPVANLNLPLPPMEVRSSEPLRAKVLSRDPKCAATITIPNEHLRALLSWRERYLSESKALQSRLDQ